MTLREQCDQIINLIDEVLDAPLPAFELAGTREHAAAPASKIDR